MRRAQYHSVVAALVLATVGVLGIVGEGPVVTAQAAPPVFPVRANGAYLVDANNTPFPILGRVCWMVTRLSPAQYRAVLDDSAAKGFTAIEVKPPLAPNGFQHDSSGNLPFLKRLDGANWAGQVIPYNNINAEAPDFTTPNEAFWTGVDAFFAYAEQKGLLVMWFPAYVGYHNTDWWMDMMVANGATRMRNYGAWVANRYRNQRNLVWMIGGDKGTGQYPFSNAEMAAETAFVQGLKSVATVSTLYSSEWVRGSMSKDLFASDISLNGTYSSATDIINQGSRAWAFSPRTPAYAQEYPFEDAPNTGNVRPLTMYAWLSTIGGYLFGNGVFTSFEPSPDYRDYMNTPGTINAKHLNAFVRSISWHTLVPEITAVTANRGSTGAGNYVATAGNADRSLFLAYVPPSHPGNFTINMSVMGGTTTARWWDPNNGTYSSPTSDIPNSGNRQFTRPGNNSAGSGDWLLVLSTSAGTGTTPPAAPTNLSIIR